MMLRGCFKGAGSLLRFDFFPRLQSDPAGVYVNPLRQKTRTAIAHHLGAFLYT